MAKFFRDKNGETLRAFCARHTKSMSTPPGFALFPLPFNQQPISEYQIGRYTWDELEDRGKLKWGARRVGRGGARVVPPHYTAKAALHALYAHAGYNFPAHETARVDVAPEVCGPSGDLEQRLRQTVEEKRRAVKDWRQQAAALTARAEAEAATIAELERLLDAQG